ncbi:hypothetical protein [Nocardia sp. NPDC049149]|uniref:hypothetical protein n=1 Tax=Nocardia sp. NPDC049149 TaxID=3364315 RepID=UPI003715BA35
MDEDKAQAVVVALRKGKGRGLSAVELARMAKQELGEDFQAITFIKVFWNAFEIPLPVLQQAACWRGFWTATPEAGTTDEELERLLEPWLGYAAQ